MENFLTLLDKHHDFSAERSHVPPINDCEPPTGGKPTRNLPPHFKSISSRTLKGHPQERAARAGPVDFEAVRRQQAANIYHEDNTSARFRNVRPNGAPRNTRRMSELFAPMARNFELANGDLDQGHASRRPEAQQFRQSAYHHAMSPTDPRTSEQANGNTRNSNNDSTSQPSSASPHPQFQPNPGPPHGDPDNSDSDGNGDDNRRGRHPSRVGPPCNPNRPLGNIDPGVATNPGGILNTSEPHFDSKLKMENVPKWDGNTDNIVRWFAKVNDIARESLTVFKQLGRIVPKRLEGSAEIWYWSLPLNYRTEIEANWDTLKLAFATYFMNRKWFDKQKGRASRATYREPGYTRETPSEYYICKTDLLNMVFNLDDSEVIMEVMDGAPSTWNTVLTTQLYRDTVDFQSAIRFHEDALMRLDNFRNYQFENFCEHDRERDRDRDREAPREGFRARVNLVGSFRNMEPPKFPKDDSNVLKRATPESKGARPCRHCGSGKHWDNECKHSFKAAKAARTHRVTASVDEDKAQEDYDELYYSLNDKERSQNDDVESDFEQPLQTTEYVGSGLGGEISNTIEETENHVLSSNSSESRHVNSSPDSLVLTQFPELPDTNAEARTVQRDFISHQSLGGSKRPLNRRTRRRLARDISATSHVAAGAASRFNFTRPLVELRKYMARPPGCSFLGSKATKAEAYVGQETEKPIDVIVDSGSDITLISEKALADLPGNVKVKSGQKINLIQVTGTSSIEGYVTVDLIFDTPEGPVKLNVEAYVVKGMTTPFILGNDFADQYSISVVRREGQSYLLFGDSGRELPVLNSTSPSLVDQKGTFSKYKSCLTIPGRACVLRFIENVRNGSNRPEDASIPQKFALLKGLSYPWNRVWQSPSPLTSPLINPRCL